MVGDSFDVLAIQQPLARWEDVADVGCNGLIAASGVEVGVLPGSDDGRVQFALAPVGSPTGAGGESRCVDYVNSEWPRGDGLIWPMLGSRRGMALG
jgi:hypothetical protein